MFQKTIFGYRFRLAEHTSGGRREYVSIKIDNRKRHYCWESVRKITVNVMNFLILCKNFWKLREIPQKYNKLSQQTQNNFFVNYAHFLLLVFNKIWILPILIKFQ